LLDVSQADTTPSKINLGVGAYRTNDALPYVFPSVREAERRVLASSPDMEYAPIEGDAQFLSLTTDLLYGSVDALALARAGRVAAIQSLSGTGALSLFAHFLARFPAAAAPGVASGTGAAAGAGAASSERPVVLIPHETWDNHFGIFKAHGHATAPYRYWDPHSRGLDIDGLLADIRAAPRGSAVLLHMCAHNPTGVDPTPAQWREISAAVRERAHLPVFDNAYQGFASGDIRTDAEALKIFLADGHAPVVCQSFAKNFGLYGQRVGLLSVLCADAEERARVMSQLKITARVEYSSPPIHGARLVRAVLGDEVLARQWRTELAGVAQRLASVRELLLRELVAAGSPLDWSHVTRQRGMFAYTGLTAEHVARLEREHHIYMTTNGRMAMTSLTTHNVAAVAGAVHQVTSEAK
jgi:aspartate aminotransferase